MRLLFTILAVTAMVAMFWCQSVAQEDASTPKSGIKPDLPLERPVPEETEEPPEEEPPGEEPPGEEPPGEAPPEEELPPNPPPEFFEEPIEAAEVIFVIDRTGSMRWPSKMSVVDEGGVPINGAAKVDVARIELIKAINNLSENIKFALVCFATSSAYVNGSTDINWNGSSWTAWPPAGGVPAPFGWHAQDTSDVPVWPTNKQLVKATADNKSAAISWSQAKLPSPGADLGLTQVKGGTSTADGMSVGLSMVTAPPPGPGPGGEPKKSATAIYLLTDGAPTHISGIAYCLCKIITSYDTGGVKNDATWEQTCMDLTKAKIISENTKNARIYTLGMGMDMACPNANVWNPTTSMWDVFPTQYNDKCRQFLTQLAESTGGHYREVSK